MRIPKTKTKPNPGFIPLNRRQYKLEENHSLEAFYQSLSPNEDKSAIDPDIKAPKDQLDEEDERERMAQTKARARAHFHERIVKLKKLVIRGCSKSDIACHLETLKAIALKEPRPVYNKPTLEIHTPAVLSRYLQSEEGLTSEVIRSYRKKRIFQLLLRMCPGVPVHVISKVANRAGSILGRPTKEKQRIIEEILNEKEESRSSPKEAKPGRTRHWLLMELRRTHPDMSVEEEFPMVKSLTV